MKIKESPTSLKHAYRNQQNDLKIQASSVKRLLNFLCSEKKVCKAVCIVFVTQAKIKRLHADFFDDPSPTDCITFPFDDPHFLGEIVVCPKAALEYAPKNPHLETSLYIIHGFLHLLGYDDMKPNPRRLMAREQKRLLKKAARFKCILATSSLR